MAGKFEVIAFKADAELHNQNPKPFQSYSLTGSGMSWTKATEQLGRLKPVVQCMALLTVGATAAQRGLVCAGNSEIKPTLQVPPWVPAYPII